MFVIRELYSITLQSVSITPQLNSDLNNRIEFTITSIDSKYAFTGNSYKHNGKVYINGYFHCNSPSVGITTCFFVPEGFRPKIKCGSACYTDDDVNFNNIGAVKIDQVPSFHFLRLGQDQTDNQKKGQFGCFHCLELKF